MIRAAILAAAVSSVALTAYGRDLSPIPDRSLTPGSTNPAVTQATIYSTICIRGWTRTVRPPVEYTGRIKRETMAAYGYEGLSMRDFELDHLIPLEVGGAPSDPRNLWPEPWKGPAGEVSLSTAQGWFRGDWRKAYTQLLREAP